jgi:hypothetical protein
MSPKPEDRPWTDEDWNHLARMVDYPIPDASTPPVSGHRSKRQSRGLPSPKSPAPPAKKKKKKESVCTKMSSVFTVNENYK